jgi:hypothetical protein
MHGHRPPLAVSPRAHRGGEPAGPDETARRMRVDKYHSRREVYVESDRLARLIMVAVVVIVAAGTVGWIVEARKRWSVIDAVRPDWFRVSQLALAIAGIAVALATIVYLSFYAITGRIWRRWRGLTIIFGALAGLWTGLWLIDRFVLDSIFLS